MSCVFKSVIKMRKRRSRISALQRKLDERICHTWVFGQKRAMAVGRNDIAVT